MTKLHNLRPGDLFHPADDTLEICEYLGPSTIDDDDNGLVRNVMRYDLNEGRWHLAQHLTERSYDMYGDVIPFKYQLMSI